MRQPASSESSPQSSDLLALKPPLSSALSSLNVYLEEELARYRRQRQGRPISPEKTSKTIKPSRKPLDLIAVKTNNSSRSQASTPSKQPSSGAVPPPPPNPFLNKAGSAASAAAIPTISNQAAEPAGQLAVAAKPADHNADAACALANHASDEVTPDDYLESSEELIKSLADQRIPESETAAQTPQPRFIWPSKLATPVSVGSFLLLLVTSAGLGYVVTNPAAVNHLFRRFRPHTHPPMQTVESANSAAGLYGGGTFRPLGPDLSNQEFIDLTLDTLSTLPSNTERLGPQPPISTSTDASATPGTPPAPPSQTQPNTAPTNPNSANLAPSSQPSVTPAPQSYSAAPPTAVSPRPTTSATPTAPRPTPSATPPVAASANPASHSPAPSVAVSPPTSTALPQIVTAPAPVVTAPVAPPAAAATASSGSTPTAIPRYRVVTPYTGDPSLDKVRGVVADAFVRESQIQAGAFEDETAAQARVQELLEQGIPAQVYAD